MRQSGRSNHQRHRDAKDIDAALGAGRVLIETKRRDDVIELVEQGRTVNPQPHYRMRVAESDSRLAEWQ